MNLEVDLQIASDADNLPSEEQFITWCTFAISPFQDTAELTIRIVDEAEGLMLNNSYRHKDYATNVLSFPSEIPENILDIPLLGDIIICAPVVEKEALEQKKALSAHWAHLVTHGCLHLLGYDHETEEEAEEMESLEAEILNKQGITTPYQTL